MDSPSLGEQELEVLQYISEHSPIAARDVVEHFAVERGLARTTILTVIERLRKKNYVTRRRRAGVYHYSPRVAQNDVLGNLVSNFMEKTLGGSLAPVMVYLTKKREMSDEEIDELQKMVDEMKSGRKGAG